MILAGLALAAVGFGGRYLMRAGAVEFAKRIPQGLSGSNYYKGGFEAKMSRREAGLILGVSPSVPPKKLKEAHKRIMLLNHPDKGTFHAYHRYIISRNNCIICDKSLSTRFFMI